MINEGDGQEETQVTGSESASRGSGTDPECIYFYYIKKKSDHSKLAVGLTHDDWAMQVFQERRKSTGKLGDEEIKELIAAADAGQIGSLGSEMAHVTLRHKAYMLFVWKENARTLRAVDFILQTDNTKKNHSFDKFVNGVISPDISVLHCVNNRINKNGGPLGNESETFDVKFSISPPLPEMPEETAKGIVIHNETATNMGP